jgi:bacillithiol biosynthesis cysteine-adding enzyme BshC
VHAYATDFPSVAPLFPGNPADAATWRAAVDRVGRHAPHRQAIVPILVDQLTARDAPREAVDAATRLGAPGAVAVVTGQQAGIFGGPLYTLLKALGTIQVAHHVRHTCGVDAVPVFWVDAEDHDWSEVRTAHVLDRDFVVADVSLDDLPGAGAHPVGRLVLTAQIDAAIGQLTDRLTPTEYSAGLAETLRRHYRPGVRLTTAFAGLMDELAGVHGLVVFEADDPRAKPLVSHLFTQELARPCGTARDARVGGEAMQRLGHAPQIVPGDDVVSLFYLDEGGRRAIRYREGAFYIGEDRREGAALVEEAGTHPERFSPNVLLRPLVQDCLFPTVCYVGGPSELAYQVQLHDVYRAFQLEAPILVSRASATLLDSAAMKFLEKQALPFEALQPQDESALNRLLETLLPPALEATFADLESAVSARASQLKSIAASVDPTLGGAVDTTLDRIRDTVKNLQGKIVQASKKKDETLRRQFMRTRALAFPAGQPQERLVGVPFFLNRYGLDLPARLLEATPAIPTAHLLLLP